MTNPTENPDKVAVNEVPTIALTTEELKEPKKVNSGHTVFRLRDKIHLAVAWTLLSFGAGGVATLAALNYMSEEQPDGTVLRDAPVNLTFDDMERRAHRIQHEQDILRIRVGISPNAGTDLPALALDIKNNIDDALEFNRMLREEYPGFQVGMIQPDDSHNQAEGIDYIIPLEFTSINIKPKKNEEAAETPNVGE